MTFPQEMYLNIAASYKNDHDIHILAKVLYIQCNLKQMIQRKKHLLHNDYFVQSYLYDSIRQMK